MADLLAGMASPVSAAVHAALPVPDILPSHDTPELPVLPSESSSVFSALPADAQSNHASFSSTPPTTATDTASVASESSKPDITASLPTLDDLPEPFEHTVEVGTPQPDLESPQPPATQKTETPLPRRARSARSATGTPVYNLAKLAGTHVHGKRRANGDLVREKRRRTVAGDTVVANATTASGTNAQCATDALNPNWPLSAPNSPPKSCDDANNKTASQQKKEKKVPAVTTRISTRSSGLIAAANAVVSAATSGGKRGRKLFEKPTPVPRELRRLQDTKEYLGIEEKPVLHTIWSNGKYIDPRDLDEDGEPVRKKPKTDAVQQPEPAVEPEPVKEATPTVNTKQKRSKKWLDKGLYAGQDAPLDYTTGLTTADKKKLVQFPELAPSAKANKVLPLPMFAGMRLLINGRDFKLPFDVCNPLPPGQPKPDEWRKMTKNRFVGDAGTYWRKTDHFKDYQSKCVCKPADGCAEDCQNRIMLYECDETNCNVGKEHCQNRAFQNLAERTKKGGRYRVGVEVVKTSDRGYGVRTNRCFEPNQIIMEYTGEIITEAECERRMNEKYKDNECYYLMAFDQNMIIDATTGSIARFVNHSCDPNCRMEKWIVHGQPRMALFAGDRPVMTGEELTYDYNFDPFSAKNVQKCLCGSTNCRGVLGPKVSRLPKGEVKSVIKETVKAVAKAGKRKLKALLDGDDAETGPTKKPKIAKATGVKRSVSAKAATAVKKTGSSISVKSKANLSSTQSKAVSVSKATLVKASKTYVKNGKQLLLADSLTSGASTIVAVSKSATANKKKANTPAKVSVKSSPIKTPTKSTIKTLTKSTIKAKGSIKSAGVKGSIKSTIQSAKHTVNKAASKKTAKKAVATTASAKKSAAAPSESQKVTKKYGKKDRAVANVGGSISVKGPRKALEISRAQDNVSAVADPEEA